MLSEMQLASQLYQQAVARVVGQRAALVGQLQGLLQREAAPRRHRLLCNPNGKLVSCLCLGIICSRLATCC